jgi:hypothetical protein
MTPLISVILAGATSLLTLALWMASGRIFSNYGWAVPYLFAASIALYLLAAILAIVHWRRERKKDAALPPPPPAQENKQIVKQEANPTQNVYVGREYAPPPPQSLPAVPQPKPQPNIRFVEAKSVTAHAGMPGGNILYESPQSLGDYQVSVVCFRNDAIPGQKIHEPSIKTHIVYRDKDGKEITDAPRGVWLGLSGESTIFESGQKKCTIVFLLSNQGTLKKLWNESYHSPNSWMSGGPLFRIRDEGIPEEVASVEINLLSHSSCLLRASFDVKTSEADKLPTLVLSSISED